MDRVMSSASKQRALMELMTAEPTLMSSFDDSLLTSLTLAAPSSSVDERLSTVEEQMELERQSCMWKKTTNIQKQSPWPVTAPRVSVHLFSEQEHLMLTTTPSKKKISDHNSSKTKSKTDGDQESSSCSLPQFRSNATVKDGEVKKNSQMREEESVKSENPPRPAKGVEPVMLLYSEEALSVMPSSSQLSPTQSSAHEAKKTKKKKTSLGISTNKTKHKRSPKTATSTKKAAAVMNLLSTEQLYKIGKAQNGGTSVTTDIEKSSCSTWSRQNSVETDSDDGQSISTLSVPRNKSTRIMLNHRCFVARSQWVPHHLRKTCFVCLRDFNMLRKRHSCRMCGEVICSRCSLFKEVDLPVVDNKFRICSCCFLAYRQKEGIEVNEESSEAPALETDTTVTLQTEATSQAAIETSGSVSESSSSSLSSITRLSDDFSSLLLLLPSSSSTAPLHANRLSMSCSNSDLSSSTLSDLYLLSSESLSSDVSCSSSVSTTLDYPTSSRFIEEEYEAILKARQLEKEVEASQQRILELEKQIEEQEKYKHSLSCEQHSQLNEARELIKALQEKLRQQEQSARDAAATRDTICLTKLRQTEIYANSDDESRALKKKLKILERQLQQAGINVAEVIPYEVAKQKIHDIALRLQEIGSSEVIMDDKAAQHSLRKEYYQLEQEMEKYNTALLMTDEYIEEQQRREQQWEDDNHLANLRAMRLVRSAIPVEIARLSEKALVQMQTPSGNAFPAELARRLKRTNVLQLLRVDPKTITRMHPSVIEGYRTTGLTLLERRALHAALTEPSREWKKQQKEEMSLKKLLWYTKLKDALVAAVLNYGSHCGRSSDDDTNNTVISNHSCKLLGLACPVRAEVKMEKLYASGLGFPETEVYEVQEILKSDPEGAGEKALLEAQAYAREMVANQRQRELKAYYKTNMREVAQAVGALEEMDTIIESLTTLDDSIIYPNNSNSTAENQEKLVHTSQSVLTKSRELVLLLAKRAGICLTGKRDPANDQVDTRSPTEVQAAFRSLELVEQILVDLKALFFQDEGPLRTQSPALSQGIVQYVEELMRDVQSKNVAAIGGLDSTVATGSGGAIKRVPWSDRDSSVVTSSSIADNTIGSVVSNDKASRHSPIELPTSAALFSAIKARRRQSQKDILNPTMPSTIQDAQSEGKANLPAGGAPINLLAAIRARKSKEPAASSANLDLAANSA